MKNLILASVEVESAVPVHAAVIEKTVGAFPVA